MYKLPDLTKTYRLYENENIIVNASVDKTTKERESQILDYYEKLGGNKNPNQEIITNGYYYDKFFISNGNEYINVNLSDNSIVLSENAEEIFNIDIDSVDNSEYFLYSGEALKMSINFDTNNGPIGFAILFFKNP